jgi:hypothetical protein
MTGKNLQDQWPDDPMLAKNRWRRRLRVVLWIVLAIVLFTVVL